MVQLNAGFIYKFANSNGTHNFTIVVPRDQAEIDALNAQINELRNRKPEVITKEVIKEVPAVKELTVCDLVFVTFAQAKYNLTNEAKNALDKIKEAQPRSDCWYCISRSEIHSSTRHCLRIVLRLLLITLQTVALLLTRLLVRVYRVQHLTAWLLFT